MNVFLRIGQAMPHIRHANTTYIRDTDGAVLHHKKSHVCRCLAAEFHARETCSHGNPYPSIKSLPTYFHSESGPLMGLAFFHVGSNRKGGTK